MFQVEYAEEHAVSNGEADEIVDMASLEGISQKLEKLDNFLA